MGNVIFVLVSISLCIGSLFLFRASLRNRVIKKFFLKHDTLFHPNTISVYGFCSTVVGLALLLVDFPHCALLFYALASFSDGADGSTARALGKSSEAGKVIDPLCDKIRYFSFFAYFYHIGMLAMLPMLMFLVVDLASQFSRFFISRLGLDFGSGIKANVFGKAKTVVADVLVGYCFVSYLEPWFPNFTSTGLFALVGLSLFSTAFKFFSFETAVNFIRRKFLKKASVA